MGFHRDEASKRSATKEHPLARLYDIITGILALLNLRLTKISFGLTFELSRASFRPVRWSPIDHNMRNKEKFIDFVLFWGNSRVMSSMQATCLSVCLWGLLVFSVFVLRSRVMTGPLFTGTANEDAKKNAFSSPLNLFRFSAPVLQQDECPCHRTDPDVSAVRTNTEERHGSEIRTRN